MTGAVDVGVVLLVSRVFDVRCRDGDTTLALLGGLVDRTIVEEAGKALFGLTLCDGGCEGGLELLVVG